MIVNHCHRFKMFLLKIRKLNVSGINFFIKLLKLMVCLLRATPGEEVPGSIPAVAARSLQFGSVSV